MQPDELHRMPVKFFPAFAAVWDSDRNLHRDVNQWTVHGLCVAFSAFFAEQWSETSALVLSDLFNRIETVVAADPDDQDPVANALCTCFLENIAQTDAGSASAPFMGPASRRSFDRWDANP